MTDAGAIAQPILGSTLGTIDEILSREPVTHIDVAAAYATTSGVRDLIATMQKRLATAWPSVRKRWVISFDYCRSDPAAINTLVKTPNSNVRVHDATRVLKQQCMPTIPFHPKAFFFHGAQRRVALVGSGNLSRSGLRTGFEAGLFLEVEIPVSVNDAALGKSVATLEAWYKRIWKDASPLDAALLQQYEKICDTQDRLLRPTPTDDDIVSLQGTNQLTPNQLLQLRACRHFWIEAGNITRNLGPGRPGNQLMMRRLSRVFFGVPATNVPQNSPLTQITVRYNGTTKDDCSLTFSDNGMDKLTLPLPGHGGPPAYDNENLIFKRLSAGVFELRLGSDAEKSKWQQRSKAIGASLSMSGSGRKWGVF